MKNCYSCVIVSALINTFMKVAHASQNIMITAGLKILVIGMFLWIAFYVLQKLFSFNSLNPMEMLQDLFKFFFKCLIAFALISSGLKIISYYFVNPILSAGADYGITVIDTVMPKSVAIDGKVKDSSDEMSTVAMKLNSEAALDKKIFNKIMTIAKKADEATSLSFVVGDALVCHAFHAGAIQFSLKITESISWTFHFPDFWLVLCGALIWFFALLVTIGVNFYLLDVSFKIGFALMALPVCIGLWPFDKFKGKFAQCLKIIVNAAGTFMFLGITTGFAILLIGSALNGTDVLLDHIKNAVGGSFSVNASVFGNVDVQEHLENNDSAYISRVFGFTSGAFILVFFAFFYSHKLISGTVDNLADKFFDSDMSGMNPLNKKATQMVDFAKKQVKNLASAVANPVKGGLTDMVKTGATDMASNIINRVRGR